MNQPFISIAIVLLLIIIGYLGVREFMLFLKEKKTNLPEDAKDKPRPSEENQETKPKTTSKTGQSLPKSVYNSNDLLELKKKLEERAEKLETENKRLRDELNAAKSELEWQEKKVEQLNQQLLREKGKPSVTHDEEDKLRKEIRELKLKKQELETQLAGMSGISHSLDEKSDALNIVSALYDQLKIKRKTNEAEFEAFIKSKNIVRLFHITERENLPSIKKYGLLSWHFIEDQKIINPKFVTDKASRELDTRYNLQDYVRLSFTENVPMMHVKLREGVAKDLVVLQIDYKVMLWEDTLFSDRNATANNAQFGGTLDDLKNIRFNIVLGKTPYYDLNEVDKVYYQAEVMVKTHIPRKYIINIENPKDFKK